jgi:hypothetical protein
MRYWSGYTIPRGLIMNTAKTILSDQLVVTRSVYTVRQFVSWLSHDEIILRPYFQRLNVWKPKAKSYLIDTIVRGLPIPIVILRDKSGVSLKPIREVVDGQQRLTTLLAYILPNEFPPDAWVRLSRVHFGDLANRPFDGLPTEVRSAILDYEISTHILPSSVDDKQVLRIFARLNATGMQLNAQELRNANYHGAFKAFAFELSLSHLAHWREWGMFTSDAFARMREVEFTSDLIYQVLEGVSSSSSTRLDKLYERFDDDFPDEDEVKRRFDAVFDVIDENYGGRMALSEFHKATWFYGLFVILNDLLFTDGRNSEPPFLTHKPQGRVNEVFWRRLDRVSSSISKPSKTMEDTIRALSVRTTNLDSRRRLIGFLREQLFSQQND